MRYQEVVVLVPGFFGFGRLGDFLYFADRLSATLRGALELRLKRAVPVLSIAADPSGDLEARQSYLLEQLRRIDADRVVALDLLFAVAIAFSLCAALASAHQAFLDVAVVLGLVGFVGTLVWSRLVEEPPRDENGGAS